MQTKLNKGERAMSSKETLVLLLSMRSEIEDGLRLLPPIYIWGCLILGFALPYYFPCLLSVSVLLSDLPNIRFCLVPI